MNLLHTRRGRATLFGLLYASEGAPIGFIWWTLPTLMRERGGEVGRITTMLAVVTAMWALKFFWAPVVDVLRGPRWGFRSWIVAAQTLMGLTLLPLTWLDPVGDMPWVVLLLLVHAFFATLQDVAIDAMAIHVVPPAQLGQTNGFMAAGKYIGRGVFGGVALIVASKFNWQWIIFGMVGWIWAVLFVVWTLPEAAGLPGASEEKIRLSGRFTLFFQSIRRILQRRVTWLAVGFALLAGAGFEAVGMLMGTYLPDRGISAENVGWFRTFAVLGAMIAGGLLGGMWTDRLGVRRASAAFLVALVCCNGVLSIADSQGASVQWLLVWIAWMYFLYGMFISASYALFMSVTDHRVAGTQFSLFMAATNGCEVWSGWMGGQIVERADYPAAFLIMSAVSLAALPLLIFLRSNERPGQANRENSA